MDEMQTKTQVGKVDREKLPRSQPEGDPLLDALVGIENHLRRLADHVDPPPADIVDTKYVAKHLGCSTDWIAKMAASGEIPSRCIVEGSGNGKPWKFHRRHIESWVTKR